MKILAALLAFFFMATPALAASPTIDGSAKGTFSSTTSGATAGLTTANSGDLIVCLIGFGTTSTSAVSVSSVTATGLSFTQATSAHVIYNSANYNDLEVWTAVASGTLSALAITPHLTANADDASVYCFGVHGLHSTAAPFDTNASLPAATTSTSATFTPPTFSTSEADDLALWLGFTMTTNTTFSNPHTPFSVQDSVVNSGGVNFSTLSIAKASFSATQTNLTPSHDTFSPAATIQMVIAFTADAATSPATARHRIINIDDTEPANDNDCPLLAAGF